MKRTVRTFSLCLALLAPGQAFAFDGDGAEVWYDPFYTDTLEPLHQYKGKYVELLLPDSWLPGDGLTDEQRRIVIDRWDITYLYYMELLGWEPNPPVRSNMGEPNSELLRIAVTDIPNPAFDGVGNLGLKELEIDVTQLGMFKDNLEDGFEFERKLMIHEMGHCFDTYSFYLNYDGSCMGAPAMCHAWTDFFDGYVTYYGRARGVRETFLGGERTADGHEAFWTDHTYLPYYTQLSEDDVDWYGCVSTDGGEGCLDEDPQITARDTWAGITHRWAELYGVEAVQRAFEWLPGNATGGQSDEEAERRHVLMLAYGAQDNIGCFLDHWEWYAPQALKAEIDDLVGPGISGNCLDFDLDGYSPLEGDCRDSNATVYPGAPEVVNGLDDDCNRYVDDVTPPPAPVLPLPHWGATLPPEKDGVDYVFTSTTISLDASIVNDTPTWVRYWVTGQGLVGYVPYSEQTSLVWTPPVGLPEGTYGFRAQLMSDTKPVSDWTDLEWFEYGGPCQSDSDCNDGNDCTVDDCTSNGLCSNVVLEDTVYEAEDDMTYSTGNLWSDDGWNIYSNGYTQFTHNFAAGWQQLTVTAAGQYANGSWPNMRITVGGSNAFETLVQTSSWTDYTFWVNRSSAGNSDVRVNFTNDYFFDPPGPAPAIDRNLLLDKVTVLAQCGPGEPPTVLALGPVNTETRYTVNGAQGLVINQLTFSGWTPARIVVGFGQTDGISMTGISVSVNGGTAVNLTGDWQTITIPYTGQSIINLTVFSSTPRGLRTTWWAEG